MTLQHVAIKRAEICDNSVPRYLRGGRLVVIEQVETCVNSVPRPAVADSLRSNRAGLALQTGGSHGE